MALGKLWAWEIPGLGDALGLGMPWAWGRPGLGKSEKISEKNSEKISEKISDKFLEKISEKVLVRDYPSITEEFRILLLAHSETSKQASKT